MEKNNNPPAGATVISQGIAIPYMIESFSIVDSSGKSECYCTSNEANDNIALVYCSVVARNNNGEVVPVDPDSLANSISLLNYVTGEPLSKYLPYSVKSVFDGPHVERYLDKQIIGIEIVHKAPFYRSIAIAIGARLSFKDGPEAIIWWGNGSSPLYLTI